MYAETKEHHALSLLQTMSGIEEEIIVCTQRCAFEISTDKNKTGSEAKCLNCTEGNHVSSAATFRKIHPVLLLCVIH